MPTRAQSRAESWDRLYLGSETCEALLPDLQQLGECRQLVDRLGGSVTLVTPPFTNSGLARFDRLLAEVSPHTEVVFNDWGALERIRGAGCRPVLGRLLVKIPRGFCRSPRAAYPPEIVSMLQHSVLDSRRFQDFLIARGIHRVELDNLVQGYSFQLDRVIRTSLYLPFVYLASGRKCVYDRLGAGTDAYRSGRACALECRTLVLEGQVGRAETETVLLAHNAHYYRNPDPPD